MFKFIIKSKYFFIDFLNFSYIMKMKLLFNFSVKWDETPGNGQLKYFSLDNFSFKNTTTIKFKIRFVLFIISIL